MILLKITPEDTSSIDVLFCFRLLAGRRLIPILYHTPPPASPRRWRYRPEYAIGGLRLHAVSFDAEES